MRLKQELHRTFGVDEDVALAFLRHKIQGQDLQYLKSEDLAAMGIGVSDNDSSDYLTSIHCVGERMRMQIWKPLWREEKI